MKKHNRIIKALAMTLGAAFLLFSLTGIGQRFWDGLSANFDLQVRPSEEDEYPLNIYALSVGKSDAMIISCEGEYALIDGSTSNQGIEILLALRRLGAEKLKAIFATHPDQDHIGGLPEVLSVFPTEQFIQPSLSELLIHDNYEQMVLDAALEQADLSAISPEIGDVFTIGSAEIEVLAPLREYASTNNSSLVLKLRYGEFSVLFCGDIEGKAEEDLLSSGMDISADVLKIAHHGSASSSSEAFLAAVGADYALIPTGQDNNKLPRSEVLRRIEASGAEIYRTDLDGNVRISSDGDVIEMAIHEF